MNKFFKRATAVAGVTVMGVAALAGCTKSGKKASSMFEVMDAASKVEKFTYEVSASMKTEDMDYEMVIYGKCDGNAATMSFEIESEELDAKLEDFIITTQNAMYVNVDSVASLITSSDVGEFDLGAYGVTGDWIVIEIPEGYENPTVNFDGITKDLNDAYSEYITEKDGKFILEIKEDDVLKSIIDTTVEFIDSHSEKWSEEIANAYESIDYEKMVRDYITEIVVDVNKELDMGISEDDVNDYIDEALSDMDLSDLEVDASEIKEGFDDFADELADSKEDAELEDMEIKVTVYQKDQSYISDVEFVKYTDAEKEAIIFSTVITEDKTISIDVPNDNVQTISDIIVGIAESMGLEDYLGSMLEENGEIDIFGDMIY